MDIQLQSHPKADIVHVGISRIDAGCAIQFKDSVRALLDKLGDRVILDLGQVEFVDSSGLGAIVASMKILNGGGSQLELAALQPNVNKVFRLTRMDKVFVIHGSPAEALERRVS
ncbi:STAS domain-containing protein [Poseidonocella sedimentorum]|uniref:Anti-sigma factor antagonist n=1 Tax=Poseidonocella sedimentorum TaxID=871652 RepID=A0A1I6E982_9RHOB|nr:STAS domain-containing protein [Poseidonocella sedimentorum]SFR14305.1 anti-sigma B factor antagonist [Poseidonocella sedimentorum]